MQKSQGLFYNVHVHLEKLLQYETIRFFKYSRFNIPKLHDIASHFLNNKPHPPRYYPGRHNKAEGGIVGSNDSEGRGLHTCIRVMKKIV